MSREIEAKLNRLIRLTGSDEGFYILALHSFVEFYLRYQKGYGMDPSFPALTWKYRDELIEKYGEDTFIEGLCCLRQLGQQHNYTNKVRHAFEYMDAEEAAAATHLFATFCTLAGISGYPQLDELIKSRDIWNDRTTLLEQNSMIARMQREIEELKKRNDNLLEQKEEYEALKLQIRSLTAEITHHELEIRKSKDALHEKNDRIDRLRGEKNKLLGELEQYSQLETYIRYLGRLSLYTRTRLDYEHSLKQLTPEQEAAVSAITMKKDFLIRGGAGTGKTIILIERLKQLEAQEELDFGEDESIVFVTFTKALTKYNKYIARIMDVKLSLEVFSTIYGLIQKKLESIFDGFAFDWDILKNYFTRERTPDFFSPEEMVSELENFIFANAVTREEYIGRMIPREGMQRRLPKQHRVAVWERLEGAVSHMKQESRYSRNYGCLLLLNYLKGNKNNQAIRNIRHLFLDEVQDVSPTALMVLKELTRGSMIMAGDTEQSLYTIRNPFARAKIGLTGRTRILQTNFRNTVQIMRIAQAFKERNPFKDETLLKSPAAFREGPVPDLIIASSEHELKTKVKQQIDLFIEDLGYEKETLCILAPRTADIEALEEYLQASGYQTSRVKDDAFSFTQRGSIRISTLHSSKGLDFPVVLLYLPCLPWRNDYEKDEMEKLLRNLVYVGLTRGMDNVSVCMIPGDDPILRDLAESF